METTIKTKKKIPFKTILKHIFSNHTMKIHNLKESEKSKIIHKEKKYKSNLY